MIKRYINITILFFLFTFEIICQNLNDTIDISDIKKITNLEKDELIILLFVSPRECTSCISRLLMEFECIKRYIIENKLRVKTLLILSCLRDYEIKKYTKIFNWNDSILVDKNYKEKLNLKPYTKVALVNYFGNVIAQYNNNDKNICLSLIKEIAK